MTDKIKVFPGKNKRIEGEKPFLCMPPAERCKHYKASFEVDRDSGKCRCTECGGEVSAIFVLTELMKEESRWHQAHNRYLDEMKRLSERSRTKCQHCGKMTRISK